MSAYRELCHDALHAHELLILEGEHGLVGVQGLKIHAGRVERLVIVRGERLANLCARRVETRMTHTLSQAGDVGLIGRAPS